MAVRSRPLASSAVDGQTTRRPGNAGEDRGARLRVVDRPALEVAAVRDAHDDRRRERVVGPPAHERQLVPELHVRRPDVVEELDLDHRLEPARGEPDRAADDVGLGERRVVHAVAPERPLQSPGHLEDAALALHVGQVVLAAAVGHVLAEDDDPRVARHLVAQADVEQVDHGRRIARQSGGRPRCRTARRSGRRRASRRSCRSCRCPAGARRAPRRRPPGPPPPPPSTIWSSSACVAMPCSRRCLGNRLSGSRSASACRSDGRPVLDLVVGQRVAVGPDDLRVHQRRALPRAGVVHGLRSGRRRRRGRRSRRLPG